MGGETSKQSGSSSATRSRERKRSGLSGALAGGDCRSAPHNPRPTAPGPSYGSIPEHIPSAPVKCAPVPLGQAPTLDRAFTWIPDTEAALVTEWNRQRQETAAAGLSGLKAKGGNGEGGVVGSKNAGVRSSSPDTSSFGTKLSSTNAAGAAAGAAAATDSTTPGVTSSTSSVSGTVPLGCDCTPATTGRTTGLTFRVPTTWTQPAAQGMGPSSSRSPSSPSSPKAPAGRHGGSKKDSSASSVVISALPVGMEYYRALQARWLTPEVCSMPPAAEEDDLNDSIILDAVTDPDGSALSPPVPLGYMIDLFVPQWRAEGLFDQAELGNQVR